MTVEASRHAADQPAGGWSVIAAQELRDLWLGGRGPVLTLAFGVLVSVIAYLSATSEDLNLLDQRESVNVTLQVAIAVGALLALLAAGDAISGERERATLESLLLTPVSRLDLVVGKLMTALSLWLAAFLVSVPYVWFLGRGIGLVAEALVAGLLVGTLLAVCAASFALLISVFSGSNRVSLSLSLFVLLALYAPTQLPTSVERGWLGEVLLRANPIAAGEHYLGRILVNGRGWIDEASWMVSPMIGAVGLSLTAAIAGSRFLELRRSGGA